MPPVLADRTYNPETSPDGFERSKAALIAAFASVELPAQPAYCAHCVTREDLLAFSGPPNLIAPDVASKFIRKVGTTWGGITELQRITPRLLCLAADNQLEVHPNMMWEKLNAAQWRQWPSEQVHAIDSFLVGEFVRLLHTSPRPAHSAHRWLGAVSTGLEDLSPLLTAWHDSIGALPDPKVSETAVHHLVELLTDSPLRPDLPATIGDLFPNNESAGAQLSSFLRNPAVDVDLKRAAKNLSDSRYSRRINIAIERLGRFKAASQRL